MTQWGSNGAWNRMDLFSKTMTPIPNDGINVIGYTETIQGVECKGNLLLFSIQSWDDAAFHFDFLSNRCQWICEAAIHGWAAQNCQKTLRHGMHSMLLSIIWKWIPNENKTWSLNYNPHNHTKLTSFVLLLDHDHIFVSHQLSTTDYQYSAERPSKHFIRNWRKLF